VCGIAGIARREPRGVTAETLGRMAASIRHRGPDGFGMFLGRRVGLASVRLSIIDVAGGAQPLGNEDGRIVIVYNGEVYNYRELRRDLEAGGHRFHTHTDTEVLVHGYEEWGEALLGRLNGQFAFAIYDRRNEHLFLARDRFGVRPLFYTIQHGDLIFASEAKALFASGEVEPAPDFAGMDEVFTFWAPRAPRTTFRGVQALEPGCCAVWRDGALHTRRYFDLDYPEAREEPPDTLRVLDELMRTGVDFRMRADVPVGGYLSGGLDSSIICALAAAASPHQLRTFSVTFDDPGLDESVHQQTVAAGVGSLHLVAPMHRATVAQVFPDVIRHTETPLVRTAPAPMFLLSRLTREAGIKVVLTGEGSDEMFLGYDLFKETAVRRFCLRHPESRTRPRLFDRLYPYLQRDAQGGEFWRRFFLTAGSTEDPLFSHLPRFQLTARIKEFYSGGVRDALGAFDPLQELRDGLPEAFRRWSFLNQAAYLEIVTLLEGYLLSSQGDRMGMANSVEGRFPFLDHRLFAFSAALPTRSKLRGLYEKAVLKRWAAGKVPPSVAQRAKQPYRAPDAPAFFGPERPAYVDALLAPDALERTGMFDGQAVAGLVRRCRAGRATGFRENQALVGILSAQLWHSEFFARPHRPDPLAVDRADVVLRDADTPWAAANPVPSGARG